MQGKDNSNYTKKVWIAVGAVTLMAATILLFKEAISVFLLILAGVLIAAFFRGFAGLILRCSGMKMPWALLCSVLLSLVIFVGGVALIGVRAVEEGKSLVEKMPEYMDTAEDYLEKKPLLSSLRDRVEEMDVEEKVAPVFNSFFQSTFGFIGDIYIILFLGIVFTISPKVYQDGMIRLVPASGREKARFITDKIGSSLKNWLKGMLVSMTFVAVGTGIGLAIMGIPMWLILALLAGGLSFIPNFGPILSLIPAALVALTVSPAMALITITLYAFVQLLESAIVTPLVQQKLVNTPPALMIIFQVFMGIWVGGWGVILAVPVLVIVMIMINELYVKPQDEKYG